MRQNFEFFAGAFSLTGKTARERIALLAQTFGLSGQMEREAGSLSGGYKQRLAMAVALINRRAFSFLTNPTSGADIPTRRQFWRWISALAEAGTTIVVTTHFMEEALYCDRILIQDAGRPLVLGTPGRVRGQSPTMNEAFVRIVTRLERKSRVKPEVHHEFGLLLGLPASRLGALGEGMSADCARQERVAPWHRAALVLIVLFGYGLTFDVKNVRVGLVRATETAESTFVAAALEANPTFEVRRFVDQKPAMQALNTLRLRRS